MSDQSTLQNAPAGQPQNPRPAVVSAAPRAPQSPRALAWKDLERSVGQSWFWLQMGWTDIQQRYRGSILGPFWLTLTNAVFIAGLGPLYAALFGLDPHKYLPFLALGIISWTFMAGVINETCNAFIDGGPQMRLIALPRMHFIFHVLWRNILVFAHSLPIVAVVLWYGDIPVGPWMLMALPGLLIVCLNLLFIGVILAISCARFRDVVPIVGSFMTLAFFVTPVLWNPQLQRVPAWVISLNPLAVYVELLRAPLLHTPIPAALYLNAVLTTVGLATLSVWLFVRYRKYIVYWV